MNVAYSERNISKIKKLTRFNFLLQGIKFVLKKLLFQEKKIIRKISLFPAIQSKEQLSDVVNRLSWGLPNNCEIAVQVTPELSSLKIQNLEAPVTQKKYITENSPIFLYSKKNKKPADALLVHRFNLKNFIRLFFKLHKTEIIDPIYFSATEAMVWQYLYYSTFSQEKKEEYSLLSKRNYLQMQQINAGKKKAYCFVTGPSFDEYKKFRFEKNSLKIICNSIVKNTEFLNYIEKPDLLVFADPVFHYSPCLYSATFREYMINVVEKYDCFVATNIESIPLLLHHYPLLETKIIGIKKGKKYPIHFPLPENPYVKSTHNILTLFMLPIASALCNEIAVLGADGRKPDEKYFWKHSSSVQLDELMQTAFDTHPSFFRDRDYADYYSEHCAYLEKLITFGEKHGKKYYSLTKSHIPAFAKRLKQP